ncbi:MAG: hypothetical protein HOY79_33850 [Streptomyces sp.]|nr:hypothetical protein [Streptomyces sp.]NUS11323.1 hypothetical protein [Streptomyces sp.]NUS23402.1 hypothetical protein [Streptomyces sp.]
MTTTTDRRDWAVLSMTLHTLVCADAETAAETAGQMPHLTAVYREPGGDWRPHTTGDEPATYVYLVDGKLTVGTLDDYATKWQDAQEKRCRISPDVRTWAGVSFGVHVRHDPERDGDGWLHYRLTVGAEQAFATVDGRRR